MDQGSGKEMVMQKLRLQGILVSKNMPMRKAIKCMGTARMTGQEQV